MEGDVGLAIAGTVPRNFVAPICVVSRRGPLSVFGASVPETAVDEHCDFRRAEREVGLAPKSSKWRAVDPVAQASGVK